MHKYIFFKIKNQQLYHNDLNSFYVLALNQYGKNIFKRLTEEEYNANLVQLAQWKI